MDVPAEFDLPQVQTILNALKNICRDYPAGGSVLRELLQNADDAQASEVKFFLDENSYGTENLPPKLAQYQGPALLAYNNAEFKKEHFQSLSQVGNSLKMEDGATTGKFGRGFNSVYNWTDSPSIVSGHRVQILDPHHSWSSGGNGYNFVEHSENSSLKAHMTVYQSFIKNAKQPFPGTIIRLPLRTIEQAKESGISDRKITAQEMANVLEKFTEDFGKEGLLFMKHVIKISVISNITGLIEIEVMNKKAVQLNKTKVNDAIVSFLKNPYQDFDCTFEMELRYQNQNKTTKMRFIVHHGIQGNSMTEEIRNWSIAQKSLPWVAVAVPLQVEDSPTIRGSLFLVMPLHIPINQPALIHGLFSISPDRARLYKSQDHSSQDQLPAQWNQYLFNSSIPHAWTKLLSHLALSFPPDPSFKYWPYKSEDPDNLSKDVLSQVLMLIKDQCLSVWHTVNGYISADAGLLATGKESESLKLTLADAQIPVVYIPARLREEVKSLFSDLKLGPPTLCNYLRGKNSLVISWPQATRQKILEYILPVLGSSDHGKGLALFPFEDGLCRSIDDHLAFVHRDEFEADLFQHDSKHNLDIKQFSQSSLKTLRDRLRTSQSHPHIRHRSASDLRKYAMAHSFHNLDVDADMVALNPDQISFATKTWTWIQRYSDILNENIASLWLLPLVNGTYRKVKPRSCWVITPPPGPLGDTVQNLGKLDIAQSEPVILSGGTGLDRGSLALLKTTKTGVALQVHNGDKFHFLLQWLVQSHLVIEKASDEDRLMIIEHIAKAIGGQLDPKYTNENLSSLKKLSIFRELTCGNDGDRRYPWVRMETFNKSAIGVIDRIIPLPIFKDHQFLDAQDTNIQIILGYQKLCVCKEKIEVLQDHIIPAWKGLQKCTWSPSSKAQTAELMLQAYYDLSPQAQAAMISLAIVPTQCIGGNLTGKFATASVLIDPENSWLKSMFFSNEEVLPTDDQYARYGSIFKKFGLRTKVDELFVYERVGKFLNSSLPREEVHSRAENLLKTSCSWSPSEATAAKYKQFLKRKWIPATLPDRSIELVSPSECRGIQDRLRADCRLPIFPYTVSHRWAEFLGWNKILPSDILLAQLDHGVIKDEGAVVNAVLNYLRDNFQIDAVSESLKTRRCVLTDNGVFITASKAFFSGCTLLSPFLGNVDIGFAKMHADILKAMNVRTRPREKDIIGVQAQIELSGHPYKESDIEILLETIKMASKCSRKSLGGLKVLDQDSILCPVEDIVYNDIPLQSDRIVDKVKFTNSRISEQTVNSLFIERLSERLRKGELQLADDDDDDEDFQQCEAITTSISTTLDRYPIESTFKEYLANADDSKASAVHWMLDPRHHPTENLLTPEMKDLQGPALLVHNDAVFQDSDFKGFKNVGVGSKREDRSTIGMFGRGSQTMYHFTDNPVLLSGDYLLILDPLQACLPLNRNWQARKPGVKILLSKLKQVHPNQLAPFQDLWGYDSDSDHYDGTIFRFPLRNQVSPLRARQEPPSIGSVRSLLDKYFQEARISLLFLKGVRVVNFKGPKEKELFWSVKMKKRTSTSDYILCSAKQMLGLDIIATEDKWWIYSMIEETPSSEYQSRLRKNVEYGIAALVQSENQQETKKLDLPTPRLFSTLPLPEASNLPVHIHATFSLSGDRNTLIAGGESSEAEGSKWNSWLLEEKLAYAYFTFLEGLAQKIGSNVFQFWPRRYPENGNRLELLCKSFWEKLPHSSARLFPRRVAVPGATNMNMSETVFDLLQPQFSKQIAPVLEQLVPNLSPNFPAHISIGIESIDVAKSMDHSSLRELFKSKGASDCLQKVMVGDPYLIGNVLRELIPIGDFSSEELAELDGCRLLPLADGTLGQLTKNQSPMPPNTRYYYTVTKEELMIFDFAKSLEIFPPNVDPYDRIGEIVRKKKFNVMELTVSHVPELLSMKSQGSRVVNEVTDSWLKCFWTYWNKLSSSTVEDLSQKSKTFCSLPLFKAKCDGVWGYYTMSEMAALPTVIEASKMSHKELYDCIPGLYRIKQELMPESIAAAEKSLDYHEALGRLVNALSMLAPDENSIGRLFAQSANGKALIKSNLIKLLRELIISYVTTGQKIDNIAYLKLLPIWPAYLPSSSEREHIAASSAKYTKQPQLLAPWNKKLAKLIDFEAIAFPAAEKCLEMMSVTLVTAESLFQNFESSDFPSTLQAMNEAVYTQFVSTLIEIVPKARQDSSLVKKLSSLALAADTNGKMHPPHELFDHDDEIFKAAFLDTSRYFLHDCIKAKEFETLWFKIGLRRRENNGCFKIQDYMECLRTLEALIKSSDYRILVDPTSSIHERMTKILSPLITPSYATHLFDHHDWNALARKMLFVVRKDNSREPSYRRENMDRVSECSTAIPLSDIVLYKHAAICWSNTQFVVLEPTAEILSKVPKHGEPFMIEVWKHLEHMVEISKNILRANIPDFLSDLFEIYDYLQNNLVRSKEYFGVYARSLNRTDLWLNLDISDHMHVTIEDLQSSWKPLQHLLLISSTDAPPLECIRLSLSPYEKLLKELGCKSIHHPTVELPASQSAQSLVSSLRGHRKEKQMIDIVFVAENIRFHAHRVVLACASGYCTASFSGRWRNDQEIFLDLMTAHTLRILIDTAYEEPINWEEMTVDPVSPQDTDANDHKLDLLLDLHKGADYWQMLALANQVERKILEQFRLFIRLENVRAYQEMAADSNAPAFERACKNFCEENEAALKGWEEAAAALQAASIEASGDS